VAGGVYCVMRAPERVYGIVKVLGVGPGAVTAKVFHRCAEVPAQLAWFDDPEDRVPGKLDEVLGMGIGLLPVTPRVFAFWQPEFLFTQALSEAELRLLDDYGDAGQPWDELKYA